MSEDVFIMGATGFLGSYVAAELLRRGRRVSALSRPKGREGCDLRLHRALWLWGIRNGDNHTAERLGIFNGQLWLQKMAG